MTTKRTKQSYVDNKRLYGEMLHYHTIINEAKSKGIPKSEWPKIPDYIGECIYLISHNVAKKPNFSSYSFVDEMIFDGMENCIMYGVYGFNPEKSKSPFNYFTTIIHYAFIRRIQKEQKQQYIKYKLMNHSNVMNNLVDSQDEDYHFAANLIQIDDDKAYKLIEKFEPNLLKTKGMKTPKGVELFIEEDLEDETDTDSSATDD